MHDLFVIKITSNRISQRIFTQASGNVSYSLVFEFVDPHLCPTGKRQCPDGRCMYLQFQCSKTYIYNMNPVFTMYYTIFTLLDMLPCLDLAIIYELRIILGFIQLNN